jgi:hypothetical protein
VRLNDDGVLPDGVERHGKISWEVVGDCRRHLIDIRTRSASNVQGRRSVAMLTFWDEYFVVYCRLPFVLNCTSDESDGDGSRLSIAGTCLSLDLEGGEFGGNISGRGGFCAISASSSHVSCHTWSSLLAGNYPGQLVVLIKCFQLGPAPRYSLWAEQRLIIWGLIMLWAVVRRYWPQSGVGSAESRHREDGCEGRLWLGRLLWDFVIAGIVLIMRSVLGGIKVMHPKPAGVRWAMALFVIFGFLLFGPFHLAARQGPLVSLRISPVFAQISKVSPAQHRNAMA